MLSDVILKKKFSKTDFLKIAGIENKLQRVRPKVRRVASRLVWEVPLGWGRREFMGENLHTWKPSAEVLLRLEQC